MLADLPPFGAPQVLLRLPLAESSGLAVAGDRLLTHEDSGRPAVVTALDRRGRVLDRYDLGVPAVDWEDMAVADGALWLADTGDNRARREQVLLQRVAADGSGPVTTYRLRYADGPRDAEALLVLPGARRVVLVTKDVLRTGVYAAPLDPSGVGVLERVADLPLRTTGTLGGPVGGVSQVLVTGGAVAPDGSRFALRTYTDLYEWPLQGEDVESALRQAPTRTPLPPTEQGEAVAYDGVDAVLTSTEGEGGPVHRLPRTAAPPTAPAGPTPAGPTPAGPTPAGPTPAGPTPAGPTPAARPGAGEPDADRPDRLLVALGGVGVLALVGLARRRRAASRARRP